MPFKPDVIAFMNGKRESQCDDCNHFYFKPYGWPGCQVDNCRTDGRAIFNGSTPLCSFRNKNLLFIRLRFLLTKLLRR